MKSPDGRDSTKCNVMFGGWWVVQVMDIRLLVIWSCRLLSYFMTLSYDLVVWNFGISRMGIISNWLENTVETICWFCSMFSWVSKNELNQQSLKNVLWIVSLDSFYLLAVSIGLLCLVKGRRLARVSILIWFLFALVVPLK